MIFCHKCGSEQLEGSEFCRKCGAKLLTDNNNEAAENNVPTETINDNVQYSNTPQEPVASEIIAEKGGLNTKLIVFIVVSVLTLAVAGVVIALIMTNGKSGDPNGTVAYHDSTSSDIKTEPQTKAQTEPKTETPTEKPTEKTTEKKTEKATEKPTEKPTEPSIKAKDLTGTYLLNNISDGFIEIYGIGDTVYLKLSYPAVDLQECAYWGYAVGCGKLKNDTVKCNLHNIVPSSSNYDVLEWYGTENESIIFDSNKKTATISQNGDNLIFTKNKNSISTPILGEVNIDSGCLNVRNGTSTDAEIIGTLDKGDKVSILKCSSDWYVVVSDDVFGYVYGEYIKTYS